ncbi:MAG: hypothetical protein SGJ09_17380 [Phycisphaerae bacterium]|nr:hypothetical protein [Phycisphaerae bacterium]
MMFSRDVIDAALYLSGSPLGIGGSAIVGALTGALAVAFTLGGVWAIRGRAALSVPTCRKCSSPLRGAGHDIPEACPECGASLGERSAVRWHRFRRQPATLAITAPVVLVGGIMLAYAASAIIVREVFAWSVNEQRGWPRAIAPADPTVTEGETIVPMRVPTIAESVATARHDEQRAWSALKLLPTRVETAPTAGKVAGGYDWGYAHLFRRSPSDARFDFAPSWRLAPTDVELMKDLVEELAGESGGSPCGSYSMIPNGVFVLAQTLLQRGYVSPEWAGRVVERMAPFPRCVMSPCVKPGGQVGIRIFDERCGPVLMGRFLSIRLNGEELFSRPFDARNILASEARTEFLAPDKEGEYDVDLDWVVVSSAVQRWAGSDLSERGSSRLRLRVDRGPELLPATTTPSADPFARSDSSFTLMVTKLGERDLIQFASQFRSSIALVGQWSVEIDGTWRVLRDNSGLAGLFGARKLVTPPKDGWPHTLHVRFDPSPDIALTLPSISPQGRLTGYLRAFDAAWGAPRDPVAHRVKAPAYFPDSAAFYAWTPQRSRSATAP